MKLVRELSATAEAMRLNIIKLAGRAGAEGKGTHIAPSLSIVEIMAVLYNHIMQQNDVFVLSKGHGGLAYYAALMEAGVITESQLNAFETDGSDFPGQPSKNHGNGIVFSSGSLGMGLSYASGLALAAKKSGERKKVYVLLGDGELNEGSNWESVMFARQHKLDNLIAIVDCNGMQSDGRTIDILDVDLESAFISYGWQTRVCNGHIVEDLAAAFEFPETETPRIILAKTVKGKGVSFMENNNTWHHNRLNSEQYKAALMEVTNIGV